MLSLAEAALRSEVPVDALSEALAASDWFHVLDKQTHTCYRIRWLQDRDCRRVLAKHGLFGFAEVKDVTGDQVLYERGRVHLCAKWPCGVKFDCRTEPIVFHGFPIVDDSLFAPAREADPIDEIDQSCTVKQS